MNLLVLFLVVFCLTKECISFTSPRVVSDKFILMDNSSKILSSKKDLCDDYVLIENGKMSLCLDKESGKKSIMLSAKAIVLTFDSPYFWQWISIPESRFEKVAQLIYGIPFKIHGAMKARFLSPRTRYSAYVVYKTREHLPEEYNSIGVGWIGHETTFQGKIWERQSLTKVEEREDGWMEVEFGEFFNENDGLLMDEEIAMSIIEIDYQYWCVGFIIQGIEFRPTKSE